MIVGVKYTRHLSDMNAPFNVAFPFDKVAC